MSESTPRWAAFADYELLELRDALIYDGMRPLPGRVDASLLAEIEGELGRRGHPLPATPVLNYRV